MKKFLSTLIAFIFLLTNTSVTYAHILKTDKTIGVVYHLEPDHDPVAGESAHISFEFKDRANKLSPTNCDCKVEIIFESQTLHTEQLFQTSEMDSLTNQMFDYTFPQKGVFTIKVSGEPKISGEFQKFSLEFDQRVSKENLKPAAISTDESTSHSSSHEASQKSVGPNNLSLFIFGAILITLGFLFIKSRKLIVVIGVLSVGVLDFLPLKTQCLVDHHCETNTHNHYECCLLGEPQDFTLIALTAVPKTQFIKLHIGSLYISLTYIPHIPRAPPVFNFPSV